MKTKTIKLSTGWASPKQLEYRIEQVTDSVDYKPGEWLSEATARALCNSARWKVTIVERRSIP